MEFFVFMMSFLVSLIILMFVQMKIDDFICRRKNMKFEKWWNDPKTEEFLYDEHGNKIWSNKKGCIGISTYVKS